jgi:hypothetical protein
MSLRFHSHGICKVSGDEMGWLTSSTPKPKHSKCGANVIKQNIL